MAEEPKATKPAKKLPGIVKLLIVLLVVIVLAAGGGLAVYKFVLAPKLEEKPETAKTEETDAIPPKAVAVNFEEAQTAVRNPDPNAANSVLLYTVSMICAEEKTKALVDKNKEWFVSMLSELHRNRTKEELNDPTVEKSIIEQAKEQANSLLRRLQEKPDPEIKIIEVLHLKFTVFTI